MAGKRLEDLKMLVAHNLACVNYAEMQAYMERVEEGGLNDEHMHDQGTLESLNKHEREQAEERRQE